MQAASRTRLARLTSGRPASEREPQAAPDQHRAGQAAEQRRPRRLDEPGAAEARCDPPAGIQDRGNQYESSAHRRELEFGRQRWIDELHEKSPRYLEIAKVSSNIWWNSARDSFLNGVGMLVQAIGSEDMIEGANAFLEKFGGDSVAETARNAQAYLKAMVIR